MKRFQDYKKLFSAIIVGIFIFWLIPSVLLRAETAEEVRDKIDQKTQDIAELEKAIKAYQAELDSLRKEKDSLSGSLRLLDITRKKLNADLSVTQKQIDKTNLQIQNLSSDIGDKESSIRNNLRAIKLDLKKVSELEDVSFIEMLLSNNDFSVFWNDIESLIAVREKIREHVKDLREKKVVLEDTRTKTVEAKNELTRLKSQLSDQQKIVIQNTAEKNKLLAQTKNSEANYQKMVQDRQAKKAAFEKELREYESRLKFILDPSKLPSPGVLSWPLKEIFVTQQFGAKTGPHRTYANGHSGTDFRARTPLPVFSMADGTVMGVGDTDLSCPGASFGKWVLIQYNNGLSSTFGHLSLVKVSKGQKVARGQTVAYSGSSGRVTGPHLHVSLYVAGAVKADSLPSIACPGKILTQPLAPINAYLDPMYYLPPL